MVAVLRCLEAAWTRPLRPSNVHIAHRISQDDRVVSRANNVDV